MHNTLSLSLRMAKKILKAQAVEPSSLPSAVQGCTEMQDTNIGGLTSRFSGGRETQLIILHHGSERTSGLLDNIFWVSKNVYILKKGNWIVLNDTSWHYHHLNSVLNVILSEICKRWNSSRQHLQPYVRKYFFLSVCWHVIYMKKTNSCLLLKHQSSHKTISVYCLQNLVLHDSG